MGRGRWVGRSSESEGVEERQEGPPSGGRYALNDWNRWFARGGAVRHTRESPQRDLELKHRESTSIMNIQLVNLSKRGVSGSMQRNGRRLASLALAAQLVSLPGLAAMRNSAVIERGE